MPQQSNYRGVAATPTPATERRSPRGLPKIPRPTREPLVVLANNRGKASLQGLLHLSRKETQDLTNEMRIHMKKYLNPRHSFAKQDKLAVQRCLNECHKIQILKRYVDCWPAEAYCRLYLKFSCLRKISTGRQIRTRERRKMIPPVPKPSSTRSSSGPAVPAATPSVASLTASEPDEEDDSEIVVKSEEHVTQSMGQPAPSPCTRRVSQGEPPTRNALRSPTRPEYHCTVAEDVVLPTISDFVGVIDPPQPSLVNVLQHAGLQSWRDLERLAEDPGVLDGFLDILVRENKMTRFQSVLFADGLRKVFLSQSW